LPPQPAEVNVFARQRLSSERSERAAINKIGSSPMVLDLPEGQRESYPARSAGYCLRQSNERSERAAIKNVQIKN